MGETVHSRSPLLLLIRPSQSWSCDPFQRGTRTIFPLLLSTQKQQEKTCSISTFVKTIATIQSTKTSASSQYSYIQETLLYYVLSLSSWT